MSTGVPQTETDPARAGLRRRVTRALAADMVE
jgi:hypothetical protein